jgi:uncharacterized protein
MAPTLSTEPGLTAADRSALLDVARRAIEAGLHDRRLRVETGRVSDALRSVRASFVTLRVQGELRGCVGTVDARRALVEDIAWNAHAAAFRDPRFPPVSRSELEALDVHLSVLSAPEPVHAGSERELIAQLRPHIDGLVIEAGPFRGTFLPAVWDQLPEPVDFLRQLKRKAGLPADYWSATLAVSRYTVESVPKGDAIRCGEPVVPVRL